MCKASINKLKLSQLCCSGQQVSRLILRLTYAARLCPGICRHVDNMPLFKQGMALSCNTLSQGIVKLHHAFLNLHPLATAPAASVDSLAAS